MQSNPAMSLGLTADAHVTHNRYEDVWQALSAHLECQIHVDDYRFGLYRALANGGEPKAPEAAKLVGFHCGNHYQEGCLTSEQAQLHSCERHSGCAIWAEGKPE